MSKQPIVSIDIIIQKGNKILLGFLGKKWKNKKYEWGLPGRELLFGETIQKCIERNMTKEVGIKLLKSKVICVTENFGFGNHYVVVGVLAEGDGKPKVMKKEDFERWEWFEKKNIPDKLFPSAKLTLKCFLKNKFA
jgi:ADP-ribose pyrophosphatase YjhB (NUDIX family)